MTKTLFTFLGRVPNKEAGYRTTCYDFGDGSLSRPVAFFGWLLHERIQPDQLVILGTAGSMWDHLFESYIPFGNEAEEQRLELISAVANKEVQTEHLQPLEKLLSSQLNCKISLRLIPYCREESEQVELLSTLSEYVENNDQVHIDVTHGFRHLPMLGLLSALHLRVVSSADIKGIWYGAFDPDSGEAPVHNLTGLLYIADWIEALSIYNKTSSYGAFQPLIGGSIGEALSNASFLEDINRIGQARPHAHKALQGLKKAEATSPAQALFQPELERRLAWSQKDNYYQRQRQLCFEHLAHDRFLEAALSGYEAYITYLLTQKGGLDPDNMEHRSQIRKEFESSEKNQSPRSHRYQAWDSLRRLRNALTHGSQPKGGEVQRALSNPTEMRQLLKQLFKELLLE